MKKIVRVIMAKPGLDGHDRGIKILARAFRDAGMEVIYLGLRQTPPMIVNAAVQEDADVIAISSLNNAHMAVFPKIMKLMKEKGIGSLLVKGCEGYVGILAERDLVYKLVSEGMDPKTTPISKIMEDSILSIAPSASPADASSLMKEYKISHLAVMEGDDVAGILSIKDLIYHQ